MSDLVHVQTHQRKKADGNFGHACLCDPMMVLDRGQKTTQPAQSNCPDCIRLSIGKLKDKIEELEELLQ